jgi:hypothetical protein
MKMRLCNYAPEPSKKIIETEVARAVTVFLRAFGTSTTAEQPPARSV